MTDTASNDAIVLTDLPVPHDRDAAWKSLLGLGETVQLTGDLAVLSPEKVEEVLRNAAVFSSAKSFEVLNSPLPMVPIMFDPPEHTRFRRILQPLFSPKFIRPLEEKLRTAIGEMIDPIAARGECEFVSEVAEIFPIRTFLEYVGLPVEDVDKLRDWKNAILDSVDASGLPTGEGDPEAPLELVAYLGQFIEERRGKDGTDVISMLLNAPEGEGLTDMELLGLCFLFVLAGLDTVTGALSFGLERLAKNPEHRQEIVDDPDLIPDAVEELLRLDPPAPFVPRTTAEDIEFDGRTLPAGSRVTNYLAVANRNPDVRDNPDEIDFHRGENPHSSFGFGPHRCLGSHLARLEMRLVYEEWHKRIPHYTIAEGTDPEVTWPRGTLGLNSLHLTFEGTK